MGNDLELLLVATILSIRSNISRNPEKCYLNYLNFSNNNNKERNMKTEALREEVSSLLRINERCNCNEDTDQRLVLAVMVLLGVCTTLFILCLYLYFQNRNLFRRISNNEEDGGISSMVLSDKC